MVPVFEVASISSAKFVASAQAVSTPFGAGVAILDFKSDSYFTLNEVGAAIWKAIAVPRSVADISGLIAEQFAVDAADCEQDVLALVSELREVGLALPYDA